MHLTTEIIAAVTLILSSLALSFIALEYRTLVRLLKIIAFGTTTALQASTDPFLYAGYAVFIWRCKEHVWALERDCCKPGYIPVAPELDGVYDGQVVRKAGLPKEEGP